MPRPRFRTPEVGGRTLKSGFEGEVAEAIISGGFPLEYEAESLIYRPDPKIYKPDFRLQPRLFIESKGRFTADDRDKMLQARRDNPGYVFVLLFQNPKLKCGRGTCASWAERYGFHWIDIKQLPKFLEDLKHGIWNQEDPRPRPAPARKRSARRNPPARGE